MILVELFSKEDCHLCHEAMAILRTVQGEIPFTLEERKITPGDPFYEKLKEKVPVVFINKEEVSHYRVDERKLRRKLLELMP